MDMIVGPGNLFVTLAKKHVFGQVAIDCLAGPSEIVVLADDSASPDYVAADLIAQAEHDPAQQHPGHLARAAARRRWRPRWNGSWPTLPRGELARDSLEQLRRPGAGPRRRARRVAWTNQHRPGASAHRDARTPRRWSSRSTTPGRSSSAITRRWRWAITPPGRRTCCRPAARPASPAACRPTTSCAAPACCRFTREGLAALADDVRVLAEKEGLTAHAASVDIRLTTATAARASERPLRRAEADNAGRSVATSTMSAIPASQHPRHGRLHARRAAARRRRSSSSTPTRTPIRRRRASSRRSREALTGDRLRKYPDPLGTAFRQTAGRVLGVDPDGILIGNGSDDILTILTRAFVPEGGLIVSPTPSYLLYRTLAEIQGARFQTVPFTPDWQLPRPWPMPRRAPDASSPIPNSPSGTVVAIAALGAPGRRAARAAGRRRGLRRFRRRATPWRLARLPNVIVTRTLSKSYALAGIRFGFAVADPALVRELVKVKDSYNCDVLSLAGGDGGARGSGVPAGRRGAKILATRARLTDALRRLGFDVSPSQANFVWATRADRSRTADLRGAESTQDPRALHELRRATATACASASAPTRRSIACWRNWAICQREQLNTQCGFFTQFCGRGPATYVPAFDIRDTAGYNICGERLGIFYFSRKGDLCDHGNARCPSNSAANPIKPNPDFARSWRFLKTAPPRRRC